MARMKSKKSKSLGRAADVSALLQQAWELCQWVWTAEKASQRLADCGDDYELADFILCQEAGGDELAISRWPELIYRYPSLYLMSDEERAEFDRRMDAQLQQGRP